MIPELEKVVSGRPRLGAPSSRTRPAILSAKRGETCTRKRYEAFINLLQDRERELERRLRDTSTFVCGKLGGNGWELKFVGRTSSNSLGWWLGPKAGWRKRAIS